jgi:pantoate--beta-alanine ligase
VFGRKDYQQLKVIDRMVKDLHLPVTVVGHPTVREADGLALSSRNVHLSPVERRRALVLSRSLRAIKEAFDAGEYDTAMLEQIGWEVLASEAGVRVDYLAIVDPERLEPVAVAESGTIAAVAARVGSTRLIDNTILGSA